LSVEITSSRFIYSRFIGRDLPIKEGDFPVTQCIGARTIALPFYNNLIEEEVDYVVGILDDILKC